MALFGKKEKPSTLEEIKRAYESLSDDDKKSFQESIKDHVDESVAAQKEDSGEKTEQSAEAEIHEAEGAEHADGKGDVEELGEKDDTPEEKAEDKRDEEERKDDEDSKGEEVSNLDPETEEDRPEDKPSEPQETQLDRIERLLLNLQADKGERNALEERAKDIYGLGSSPIDSDQKSENKKMTPQEIASYMRKISK